MNTQVLQSFTLYSQSEQIQLSVISHFFHTYIYRNGNYSCAYNILLKSKSKALTRNCVVFSSRAEPSAVVRYRESPTFVSQHCDKAHKPTQSRLLLACSTTRTAALLWERKMTSSTSTLSSICFQKAVWIFPVSAATVTIWTQISRKCVLTIKLATSRNRDGSPPPPPMRCGGFIADPAELTHCICMLLSSCSVCLWSCWR